MCQNEVCPIRLDSLRRRTHFDIHAVTSLQRLLIALLHVGQESLGIIGKEMHLAEIEDLREREGIDRYIVEKGWLYLK